MRTLKLRQAEVALSDGRLDEAYDLLIVPDIRAHRRGQTLTSQLVEKLKDRIREHRAADRFEAALKDCDRAYRLGGNQSDLAELKEDVLADVARSNERRTHQRRIQREAHARIDGGDLTLGHVLCEQLPDANQERKLLSAEIQMKQQAAGKSIERAEAAISRDDFQDTVDALCEAKIHAAQNQRVKQLSRQTCQSMLGLARSDMCNGQLVSARRRLSMIERLAEQDLELATLTDILNRCEKAADCLCRRQLHEAREHLLAAGQMLSDTTWIDSTLELIETAQAAHEALQASPLSLMSAEAKGRVEQRQSDARQAQRVPVSAASRLLVRVDGAGRLMAIAKPALRVGPRRAAVDLPLQMTRSIPTLLIERRDDDYFISTAEAIELNGQQTKSSLLSDGDQITIGSRCSIKFRMPCAASRTALLQITGSRLEPRDVRTVILMDDAFLIGPDAQAHIRVRNLQRRFAVVQREGRLYVQCVAERGSESSRRPIELGVPVDLGGAALQIDEADG